MSAVPMLVELVAQFAEREPLQIKCENSVPRQRDATLLFVFDRFSRRAYVPVDIQDRGYFAAHVQRLVKNRAGLEPGNDLVAQLAHLIAVSRRDAQVFELGW